MLKDFIYDIRALKYRCVQSYFHFQLEEAQKMTEEGKGDLCVRDEQLIKSTLMDIKNRFEENNNTYENMLVLAKLNPIVAPYYNVIGQIVKKHFASGEGWIPSFLAVEVLRQFQEKGYSDFNDIDLVKLLEEYEKFEDKKKGSLGVHYKCAEEIVKSISAKKVFKKKRK